MALKHIGIAGAALLTGVAISWAQTPPGAVVMQPIPGTDTGAVSQGGGRTANIHILSPSDHDIFTRAFAAGARGDWVGALALGNQGQDAIARQLLQWRYALDRKSGAKFADIDAALKMATGWPLRNTLYSNAEAAITPDMGPSAVMQWFGTRAPASAIGRIRLGEALVATGDKVRGPALIRQGWSDGSFDDVTEAQILAQDASYLTPESDRARLDALLWRNQITAARRQMARVDTKTANLAQARIALVSGLAHAGPALAKVPGVTDPTLLYDWARALRAEHKDADAHAMLLKVEPASLARDHTARWWNEVAVEARDALTARDPRTALALVDHAALPVGDQYAEQQFLGGFIALRFLKDPARAMPFFQRLGANVTRPISKSRAEYWQGRTDEALNDSAAAWRHYRLAAAYPETFYGQLAIARTEADPVLHLNDTMVEAAAKTEIETDALMPQIKVLADLGQDGDLRLFAEQDAAANPAPRHLKQLLESLSDWGYRDIAVRLAKEASYAGAPMLGFAYPTIALPPYTASGTPPQPALVHALIRQETEFDSGAVSPKDARGLMQVVPAAAKTSARAGNLPYRPNDLLSDTNYNMQLGMIEFASHYASWNNSLVLAAAAYNAGPGNVRKWTAALGDPSSGAVDAVDWIEQIPFGETRNYVQRVLENMEVYKNRLAGKDMPLTILADLYAPTAPPAQTVLSAPPPAKAKTN